MALKKYKPITNGRRNMTTLDFAEITKTTPEKSLLQPCLLYTSPSPRD